MNDRMEFEGGIYEVKGLLSIVGVVTEEAEVCVGEDGSNMIMNAQGRRIEWGGGEGRSMVLGGKKIGLGVGKVMLEVKGSEVEEVVGVGGGLCVDSFGIRKKEGKIVMDGYKEVEDKELGGGLYWVVCGD